MRARNLLTALLPVLALSLAACGTEHGPREIERPVVSGVVVERIIPATIDESYEASGTVTAKTVSAVSSRVMGTVTTVHVKEGQRVKAGELLLTLDARDLGEKVKAAESAHNEALKALGSATEQRDLAEKTYERFRKLHEQNALSTQELDNVETRKNVAELEYQRVRAMVKRAEAGLKEARVYKGFARITSPIDGIVSSRKTDTGSMATPGMPLMMVEDDSAYKVEAAVDERFLGTMVTGMGAEVSVSGRTIEGRLVEIVPSVDPVSRTFVVKLEVEGGSLRSGQYVKVSFATGRKVSLLVPAVAVVRKGQLTGVYRVDGKGLVIYRLIKAGKMHGQSLEVLSGIEPGDRIVTGNIKNAIDGGIIEGAEAAGQETEKESSR
jgi:RND family efflux transporter MFP subunit